MQIVSFCCNDERGHTSDRVTAIHLPEGMLDLETEHERGLTFREVRPHQIRVSRRTWRVYGYRPWYGNLFWNGYALKDRDVISMLVWAKESKKFQCDGGWETLCDWWDRNTGYDEADLLLSEFKSVSGEGGA